MNFKNDNVSLNPMFMSLFSQNIVKLNKDKKFLDNGLVRPCQHSSIKSLSFSRMNALEATASHLMLKKRKVEYVYFLQVSKNLN